MMPPLACLDELAAIQNVLNAARMSLRTGIMPNMVGIDQSVAALCVRIQQAEKPIQQECLPALTVLLKELDAVAEELRAWYDQDQMKEKST